jgi:PHP family Zn ribbon phosphoesterase
MTEEEVHNVALNVHDHEHESVKNVLKGWNEHKTDFEEMRHAVDHDPNKKIYIGNVVFEKKDGKYNLRKSNSIH